MSPRPGQARRHFSIQLIEKIVFLGETEMKQILTKLFVCVACLAPSFQASAAVTVGVDPSQNWLGFMNWFELPENGGGYVQGSAWGTADLVAIFSGADLTLKAAPIPTSDAYWYQGGTGGPGVPGNKSMEANFYIENSDTLVGETLTFEGNILSNSLTSGHSAIAFIKDFAPDYSSSNITSVPLTPGNFSITLATDPTPGRHVQYGFAVSGPNVWPTDLDLFGNVKIGLATAGTPGDFDDDGDVDGQDFLVWQRGGSPSVLSAGDLATWQGAYGNPLAAVSAVPEPASISMLVAMCGLLVVRRGRHNA